MSGDDFTSLERQLADTARDDRLDPKGTKAAATADELSQRQRDEDRSYVVRMVIGLYVASLAAIILYLIIRGICSDESAYANISDIIKVAIVPIVTLVIGYYFGKEKS